MSFQVGSFVHTIKKRVDECSSLLPFYEHYLGDVRVEECVSSNVFPLLFVIYLSCPIFQ